MSGKLHENAIDEAVVGLRSRLVSIAETLGGKRRLAQESGLSETQIYRYIKGEHLPGLRQLLALAHAGHVSLEWLATGRGTPDGPVGSDARVMELEAEVARLRGELARLRAALRDAGEAGVLAMVRELGLDELALMAQRGTQATRWYVLSALARAYPEGLTLSDLVEKVQRLDPSVTAEEVMLDLRISERQKAVVFSDGTWRLAEPEYQLRAEAPGDVAQAVREGIQTLLRRILPRVERKDGGYFVTAVLDVPEGDGRPFVSRVVKTLYELCHEKHSEKAVDEVTLVFGVAVTQEANRQQTNRGRLKLS